MCGVRQKLLPHESMHDVDSDDDTAVEFVSNDDDDKAFWFV